MLPACFDPSVKIAPFCVLARAALESLFRPQQLNELFPRTAQHQHTRELLFSQLAELMIAGHRRTSRPPVPSLSDRRIKIIDGNALSATEHRPSELRDIRDALVPGKVLAVFDPRSS